MLYFELNESSREELKQIFREIIQEELLELNSQSTPPNIREEKDILTRKEAMELLNCSHSTLYRYQKEGEVPYFKIGKKVLFKKSELLEFIKIHQN
ncbi:helix-turn-helix domain-containing protein [Carboxylicivirga mesophila]|uniref:Helix-turn-helix domain-containing protein n=1 Tax=Carboxylicivirga mesophila TaxID=1166478 RepID=A0ABS5K5I3_9BACT|nr:helix-turn-helix domain-containing protein [Carboxylicivirga mesophila]MBS2210264.1 helix-turn-helix domain-containing protein [Carboxylicivirga mesophila]